MYDDKGIELDVRHNIDLDHGDGGDLGANSSFEFEMQELARVIAQRLAATHGSRRVHGVIFELEVWRPVLGRTSILAARTVRPVVLADISPEVDWMRDFATLEQCSAMHAPEEAAVFAMQ